MTQPASLPVVSASFRYAVQRTLSAEGLWSNHPSDRGGPTRYGITEAVALKHRLRVSELTRDQAVAIYHSDYWLPLRLDQVRSRNVSAEIFDTAVNMGLHAAAEIAQQSCSLMGAAVAIDGRIGPATLAALNSLAVKYEAHLLACLNGFQFARYVRIYQADPNRNRAFIRGWLRRLLPPAEVVVREEAAHAAEGRTN